MRLATIFLGSVLLASCGPSAKFDGSVEDRVAFTANTINTLKPVLLGGDASELTARADGDVLVLELVDAWEGPAPTDENELRRQVRPAICDDDGYEHLFEAGARVRLELQSADRDEMYPVTIAHCS